MRRVIMTGAKYESAPLMSALKEVGAPKTLLQLHIFKVPANSRAFAYPKHGVAMCVMHPILNLSCPIIASS